MRNHLKSIQHISKFFLVAFLLCASISHSFGQDNNKIRTVVIDPGHGGKDSGARGKHTMEKDIVLNISLMTGKYIKENFEDVKVIYTRTEDVFIPLHERAEVANKNKADLFLSIHCNASPNSSALGTETFAMGLHKTEENFEVAKLENQAIYLEEDYTTNYEGFNPESAESYIIFSLMQNIHLEQSLDIASHVQHQFRERTKRKDRGVKQAGFLVLWRTSMPSVLIETGFISNQNEEKFLSSKLGQDYIASAIYRAFRDYKQKIEKQSILAQKEAENPEQKDSILFKVQVLTSSNPVQAAPENFHNLKPVNEYKVDGKFKYTVGKAATYDEISGYLEKVRNYFPDAFIIAVEKGNIIPVATAMKKINNRFNPN
jgi:N-acetylmuramoyl-L-alanine amidase